MTGRRQSPLRLFMAVAPDGAPKRGGGGCIPLYDEPADARHGWGPGFAKPGVVEVELRVIRRSLRGARR